MYTGLPQKTPPRPLRRRIERRCPSNPCKAIAAIKASLDLLARASNQVNLRNKREYKVQLVSGLMQPPTACISPPHPLPDPSPRRRTTTRRRTQALGTFIGGRRTSDRTCTRAIGKARGFDYPRPTRPESRVPRALESLELFMQYRRRALREGNADDPKPRAPSDHLLLF
jgi:hypothetical protein